MLVNYNIRYSIVTTRGALLGRPVPQYGSFTPLRSPSGLKLFVRDAGATKAVWSETEGYPADPVYRDFYRDIGYDLNSAYVSPYLGTGVERGFTGYKYWAVTGKTDRKRPMSRWPPRPGSWNMPGLSSRSEKTPPARPPSG